MKFLQQQHETIYRGITLKKNCTTTHTIITMHCIDFRDNDDVDDDDDDGRN